MLTIESRDWTPEALLPFINTGRPYLPEIEAARSGIAALRDAAQARIILGQTEALLAGITHIPQPRYSAYRRFVQDGDRREYETPYFARRKNLAALALRLFMGVEVQGLDLRKLTEDYIWAICEETNWVVPAHERAAVDLFSAETGSLLAQTLTLLGDQISPEVRHRVIAEVNRRIFEPYLYNHPSLHWYTGHNNWNGVCNSSVASTFLLLEPDTRRAAWGLSLALHGLRVFLDSAFESDGSSNEGVSYWHYGLINFVTLSEMLRARSGGELDLLASPRMRQIAAYPAKMQLSGPYFAAFSDCDEECHFNFGIIERLAERTGVSELRNVMAPPAEPGQDWRLVMMLRSILWWDGATTATVEITDAVLEAPGIARLTGRTAAGVPYVVAIKAGHNAENHNQNDIGSFVLHIDGENLLTDPGRGLYRRQYFGPQRYENIFANSFGHSVPRIGGQLQAPGETYRGRLTDVSIEGGAKRACVEMAGAYPVAGLAQATRTLTLGKGGVLHLDDAYAWSGEALPVEEALVTWCEVSAGGPSALVQATRHNLRLTIEEPAGAEFAVEALEEACQTNLRAGVLKRLSVTLPTAPRSQIVIRMQIDA